MSETIIRLENLIKSGQDLSPVCKGQCTVSMLYTKRHYCTLSKMGIKINCSKLYSFSDFPNACLYNNTKPEIKQHYNLDENMGDC